MKIVNEWPPNIKEIEKVFNIKGKEVVFTYGDILYNPHKVSVERHLLVHEQTHEKQQNKDPESWWTRYLRDKSFRLSQEVEAYQNQFRFIKNSIKDSYRVVLVLDELADHLSSRIYGNIISFKEARKLIKS